MPLLLSNNDIRTVLNMNNCLKALENAFKQEGAGTAANRTKSTIYITPRSGRTTHFVSIEGGIRNPPVFGLSIRSHIPERDAPPGARFLMLFSGETGELLALLRGGEIDSYRVGGTAGLVIGISDGSAIITATAEGKSGTALISVSDIPVASVTVSPPVNVLTVGTSRQLVATVRDGNGTVLTGFTVTWSSSDPSIAIVSSTGLVTSIMPGSAIITATAEGISGSATIHVVLPS